MKYLEIIEDNLSKAAWSFWATSRWFEWLQWILILAFFEYLAHNTKSRLAWTIIGISGVLMWLYFSVLFFRLGLKCSSLFRSNAGRLVSIFVAGCLSAVFLLAAQFIAYIIAAHTK